MKLILYNDKGHRKNYDALQRMCRASNIEYEYTTSKERLRESNYDILISFSEYIPPDSLPDHVKIVFGPHAFVFPHRGSPFVGPMNPHFESRAVYTSLSKWVHDVYMEHVESFLMPIVPLPFAVDVNTFSPSPEKEKDLDCILYYKHRKRQDCTTAINAMINANLKFEIITYGKYKEEHYIHTLRRAKFMIVLDGHESQGFALQEAMSCGVPLLVIDATNMYDESTNGYTSDYERYKPMKLYSSSVPYWSDECGIKTTLIDLPEKIQEMTSKYHTFRPRDYIVRELSEIPCMKRILNTFGLQMP